jgi:GH24 family phage-related lysozyme (muramidase)
MIAPMRMRDAALQVLMSFEDVRLMPYTDAVGIWTIGIGHVMVPNQNYPGVKKEANGRFYGAITRDFCLSLFRTDIRKFEDAVNHALKVVVTQPEFEACVMMAFNTGAEGFHGTTLCNRINASGGNHSIIRLAVTEFLRWNHAGGRVLEGLTIRCILEAAHFLNYRMDG